MSTEPETPTGPAWPDGVGKIILDETDSTMKEAQRRAESLDQPTWILALRQTAAKGRRGRPWDQGQGNFAATLVWQPHCDPAEAALRSFSASLALYRSLTHFTSASSLSLKWPNDVLLEGRKVAGILLESQGKAGKVDQLSIGIGVNLRRAPELETLEPGALAPISLAMVERQTPTPEEFLTHLAHEFAGLEHQFQQSGFASIREAWLSHAAKLGETITARTMRETIIGRFDNVDLSGNLVLNTEAGPRTIPAAEVYF